MIDERGRWCPDYKLSALVLKIVLERVKKGNVIISVNSSSALEKTARDAGCTGAEIATRQNFRGTLQTARHLRIGAEQDR